MELTLVVGIWIVCGIASVFIAQSKGATNLGTWFVVGLLLGPLGVLVSTGAKPPGAPAEPRSRTNLLIFTVVLVVLVGGGVLLYANR